MPKWKIIFTYLDQNGARRTKEREVTAKNYTAAVELVKARWQPIFGKIDIAMWEKK